MREISPSAAGGGWSQGKSSELEPSAIVCSEQP